ncbi:MAG: DMT family transporter [Desertifilum sp.]|nr:DMT family transporter [Desertifilum sp.]
MTLHTTSGRWRYGLALALLTACLWGVLPIALSITLQTLDVYTLTWFRFLAAFSLLALYLAKTQQLPTLKTLRSTSWGLLAIATLFLGLNYLLYLQGLVQTSPANAQVLIQLAPVLMGFGGLAIFKERYTLTQWGGVAILTTGFSLFFHEQLKHLIASANQYISGSLLIAIAAAVWAVYALAQKQLLQQLPSSNIMLIVYGICALLFSPFATPGQVLDLSPVQWGMLIFCALNTLVAYGAFAESLEHWEASRVSAVLATTPIVTLASVTVFSQFLPHLLPPEQLTLLGIMGAGLVMAGSIAIALGKHR